MINIVRTDAPDILVPTPDASLKVYARPEVRQALIDMQHGKCCYCEKLVDLTDTFPDDEDLLDAPNVEKHIEHFRPKGRAEYRDRTNEWLNLLLACNTCNVNKGQKFSIDQNGNPLCIDPSDPSLDPEDHLALKNVDFKVSPDHGKLMPRDNSEKGRWTIANVKLNQSTCRRDRWIKVSEIVKDILDYIHAPPGSEQSRLRLRLLNDKRSSKSEFSFVAREVCNQFDVPVEADNNAA